MTVFGINFYANDILIDTMVFDSVEARNKAIHELNVQLTNDGYYVDSMCFEMFDKHVYNNNEDWGETLNNAMQDWKDCDDCTNLL